jgi:hypothetical protein
MSLLSAAARLLPRQALNHSQSGLLVIGNSSRSSSSSSSDGRRTQYA